MILPACLLAEGNHPSTERFRFGISAGLDVESGERTEALDDVGMIGIQILFSDLENFFLMHLCLGIVSPN
jgi:hypothetical protein